MGAKTTPPPSEVSRLGKYKLLPSESSAEYVFSGDSQFSGKKRKLREYSEKVQNLKERFDRRVRGVQEKEKAKEKLSQNIASCTKKSR